MSKRDYYEVLGVARHAAESELKSAYRKLALQHHPDRNPGDKSAEERFKEAAEAYAVLSDPQKRAACDRFGHAGVSGASGGIDPSTFVGFEDILGGLGDVFGLGDLFGGGRRRGGPQQRLPPALRPRDQLRGGRARHRGVHPVSTRRELRGLPRHRAPRPDPAPPRARHCGGRGQLRYQQGFFTVARTCNQCRGTGLRSSPSRAPSATAKGACMKQRKLTVKIPGGIDTGQRLRIQGEGEHGVQNGPRAISTSSCRCRTTRSSSREGNDLYCEMPLHFPTLALGGEIKVATLLGEPEPLKVPEGTVTGTTFRLRGKGLPDVGGRGKGDLFVTVHATTPKKLTKEQRQLLESLARSLPPEKFEPRRNGETHDDKNIFDRVKDIFG